MFKRVCLTLIVLLILAGCGTPVEPTATGIPTLEPTATLAGAQVQTTNVPDAQAAAGAYLDSWLVEDYDSMYAMLTQVSRDAITLEDFTTRYRNVANEAALSSWEYEVLSSLVNPRSAQVGYRVVLHSLLVGDIQADTAMNLSLEDGGWHIQWDDALILPELRGGNYLRMDYSIPSRANIYASDGSALVAQADAVAIGLDTGAVDPESQNSLLRVLYELTGVRPESLGPRIDAWRPYGYYLPVADVSTEALGRYEATLAGYSGVILQSFRTRYYFNEGIAPHVVGYMSLIQPDEVDTYRRLGYRVDERVGRDGLEYWGEQYLAGQRGGTLYVVDAAGSIITTLSERAPQPAEAIYTTIDYDLQLSLQRSNALSDGMLGAIVVVEVDTGRVLAMLSAPSFNPNLFEPQNYNFSYLINDLYAPTTPLLNRATQGQYPLGSVFKIITISAALQSGLYTEDSEYMCGYFFEEIPGHRPNDWTYDHFLEDGRTQPSGLLTLPEGLMRSCNPWFWHIGLDFYNRGMFTAISDMSRSFGLGSLTGIEIGEEVGAVPEPYNSIDAINLAIGQGSSLVTPLQVANFIAAVGNGGTLYQPQVIDRVLPVSGDPTYEFSPIVRGTLPISAENMDILQQAMYSVVMNPRGTAYRTSAFGLNSFVSNTGIPIFGKTGTAESGYGDSHAWFAGYSDANRENRPDIAVVVLVEYGGEGSEIAAPIFRRVMEIYFQGSAQMRYPWEAMIGVVATPTPLVTDTPVSEETATVTP
ncbi:MAG TPA: penicillin-binding transpeptidase domain-containing protein [Anaerolineales bacterium]|nr:penicillin-binding transpeptidase domain-containing protein [Anaerolineales bacterium]